MARKCTVCEHTERTEIEKAMIRNESYQNIALRFGISVSAVFRHRKAHVAKSLLKSREAQEAANAAELVREAEAVQVAENGRARDVMVELERCFCRANLLFEACDKWLRDPDDPTQYDLSPRAEDVWITLIEPAENGNPPIRRKKRLSVLLEEINGAVPGYVTLVETKTADPRKLVLSAIGELRELTGLQLKIFETLNNVRTIGEFQKEVVDSIGQASPEIRENIIRNLQERRGIYQNVEFKPLEARK
jgi:hypothetical protein